MKRKRLLLLLASAALLAGCNFQEVDSSIHSSSEGSSLPPSSSIIEDSTSSSVSSSEIEYGTLREIAIDAIPSLGIKETLDLTPYVHFKDDKGQEMPLSALKWGNFGFSNGHPMGSVHTGSFALPEEGSLKIIGTQTGTADIRISYSLTDADIVYTDATFEVTGSAETAALKEKWNKIGENFTLVVGEDKAYRTENYIQDINGKGLIKLKDEKAYSFTKEGETLTVYPGAKDGSAKEAFESAYGKVAFEESSFAYSPLSTKDGTTYDFALRQGATYAPFSKLLGLDSAITLSGVTYYLYQFSFNSTAEGYTLLPILIDITSQLVSLPAVTLTDLGTSKVADLDAYIASGKIPEANITPILDFVHKGLKNHNYTIKATGEFYTEKDDGSLEVADKSLFGKDELRDFYTYSRKERAILSTADGLYMHYYQTNESSSSYSEVNTGYFNHKDGYVCTFSMQNGVAKIGSKDTDWYGADTLAPYWNTYKKGLPGLTDERLENANFIDEGKGKYSYAYSQDTNTEYGRLGTILVDITHYDIGDLITDKTSGTPIINNLTGKFTLSEESLAYTLDIPMAIDETTSVLYRIEGAISDIDKTVIAGLTDILSGTPESGSDGGDWSDW